MMPLLLDVPFLIILLFRALEAPSPLRLNPMLIQIKG